MTQTYHTMPVTTQQATSARDVICNPAQFAEKPALRAFAWAVLKQQRGQGFNPAIIHQMQTAAGLIPQPRPGVAAILAARMQGKTWDEIGYPAGGAA